MKEYLKDKTKDFTTNSREKNIRKEHKGIS
jgi:hypothetical protein